MGVQPTASSFVLDLLVTLKQGSMPVRALVEAGRRFGIAENSLRVALARLLARGRVERDARGRYRLGPGAEPVRSQVVSWRRLTSRQRPWDGSWLMVHLPVVSEAARRRRSERALRLLGLRALEPALRLRPDNLQGGVEDARERLVALGLDSGAHVFEARGLDGARERLLALGLDPRARVFQARGLDDASDAEARRLWDVEALEAGYAASLEELERSARRLPDLPEAEAMVESFLLGGRMIRQLVLDPLLPEEILPSQGRDALVAAMRAYDRAGRRCWARFLDRYSVPHLGAPADTRIAEGTRGLELAVGGAS